MRPEGLVACGAFDARPFRARVLLVAFAAALSVFLSPGRVFAAEADAGAATSAIGETMSARLYSEYVTAFLNNEFLLENIRLVALAEERQGLGFYDEAVEYAKEAMRYAKLSDEYVASRMRMRETDEAIKYAEFRLELAESAGAPEIHPGVYGRAQLAFEDALSARDEEAWDAALNLAFSVVSILSELPDVPVLPARFLVGRWEDTRDCLWNIAALPEVFGDGAMWPHLYDANIDIMPQRGNPDLIHPGMILEIPQIAGETRHGTMEMP